MLKKNVLHAKQKQLFTLWICVQYRTISREETVFETLQTETLTTKYTTHLIV